LQSALETTEIAVLAMTAKLRQPDDTPADKPKRKPIPGHIPRVEVEPTPGSAECAQGGGKLRRLGEDATEELEQVPGRSPPPSGSNRWRSSGGSSDRWRTMARYREPHPAPALRLFGCERFSQSPLPSRPIERGRPGPGLLAHVLVDK